MRSSLELLLLSFVEQGLRTPYELKARAGLSLGSTLPALARLEQAKLLSRSEGPRGSMVYEITRAGARAVSKEWKNLPTPSALDTEGVLRTAYLVWKYGSPADCSELLKKAAISALGQAKVAGAEAERFSPEPSVVDTGSHRWLRSKLEAARLESEATAFNVISKELLDFGEKRVSKRRSRAVSRSK